MPMIKLICLQIFYDYYLKEIAEKYVGKILIT